MNALQTVDERTRLLNSAADFTTTPEEKKRLDGVCMLFAALGESLKNLDKITNGELMRQYPGIDWTGVKGFRAVIAHHYFDVDAEQVFWVCKHEVPQLLRVVRTMSNDLSSPV